MENTDAQQPERRITTVYTWENGMVMVFDQHGEQMPAYQGRYLAVRARILRDAPPDTTFYGGSWVEPDTLHEITF